MKKELLEAGFKDSAKLKGPSLAAAYDQKLAEQKEQEDMATTASKKKKQPPAAQAAEDDLLGDLDKGLDESDESLSDDDIGNTEEEARERGTENRPIAVLLDDDYKALVFDGGAAPTTVDTEDVAKFITTETGRAPEKTWLQLACRWSTAELKMLLEENGDDVVDLAIGSGCCPSTTERLNEMLYKFGESTDSLMVVLTALGAVDRRFGKDDYDEVPAHHLGARTFLAAQKRINDLLKLNKRRQATDARMLASKVSAAPRAPAGFPGIGIEDFAEELNRNTDASNHSNKKEEELEALGEKQRLDPEYVLTGADQGLLFKGLRALNSVFGSGARENLEGKMRSDIPESEGAAVSSLVQLKMSRLVLKMGLGKALGAQDLAMGPLVVLRFEDGLGRLDLYSQLDEFNGVGGLLSGILGLMHKVPPTIVLQNFDEVGEVWLNRLARIMWASRQRLAVGGKLALPWVVLDDDVREETKQLVASLNGDARRHKRERPLDQGGQGGGTRSSSAPPGQTVPEFCPFFLSGNCRHGDKCKNPHVDKKDIKCPYLAKGSCSKGSACDWKH